MSQSQKHEPKAQNLLFVGVWVALLCALLLGGLLWFERAYTGAIYPRVRIGSLAVGGKTPEEALTILDAATASVLKDGLSFTVQDKTILVPAAVASENFSYDILTFDHNTSVAHAYAVGRDGSKLNQIARQISTLLRGTALAPSATLDEEQFRATFEEIVEPFETPTVNATLAVAKDGSFIVQKEQPGQTFPRDEAVVSARTHVASLAFSPIPLTLRQEEPAITEANVAPLLNEAETILSLAPLTLTFEESSWTVSEKEFKTWIAFAEKNGKPTVGLDPESVEESLKAIREDVDIEAKNGKFVVEGETVREFQAAQTGRTIDTEKTLDAVRSSVLEQKTSRVALAISVKEPDVAGTIDPKEFGITALLGTGHTSFKGSPPNRIHNITNGVGILNGLLIKPDEEFSLVQSLLPFDLEHGWKEELVIKGNRTIPEVGGGGCQIGTTFFRAAMNSAMPITARRAHSYIVSYYYDAEGKPGKDATIYDPQPDFRFKNDTSTYILIQARIEGFDFYVDFWGTTDGRAQEQTSTVVSNWTTPPPAKTIKTTDIPKGERKQLEKAHKGATTSFDYTITYPNGTQDKTTFTSKYKAWQEVWLEGVTPEELAKEQAQKEAKSPST